MPREGEANGRAVVTRPQAGVPYALPDGSVIINNGDGTYNLVSTAGQTTRRAYPASVPQVGSVAVQKEWIPGVPNWAVLAGGGLLAALAMRR